MYWVICNTGKNVTRAGPCRVSGPSLDEYMASLWEKFAETNDGSLCNLQHWKISHSFIMLGSFQQPLDSMGLLNISLPWHVNARRTIDVSSGGEWSKKLVLSLFEGSVQQGRRIACCVPGARPLLTRGTYSQYVSTAKWRERRWRLF